MANFHVKEQSVHCIVPATPSGHGQLLPLSTFDLMQKRDVMPYLQRVCFFEGRHHAGGAALEEVMQARMESLKRGLSLVLVHFYPFAGRLIVSDGSPFILCDDSGVEFCVASVDAPLCRVDFSQPPCTPFFCQFIKRGNYELARLEDRPPLFSIQVTNFECGGMCIAWSFDHILADGNSLWHFISSWAESCTGQKISHPPNHSRDFEKTHIQLKDLSSQLSTIASPFAYKFKDMSKGVIARSFKFSEKFIQNLKLLASSGQFREIKYSSYEVLSAHLWRAITRARDIPDKSKKIGYCIASDIRRKLSPPLPNSFCGNAILMPIARATVKDIETQDVAYATNLIREAIQSFSIDDILASIKNYKLSSATKNPLGLDIDEEIHVWHGGSPRFPLYSTDFGWGNAVSVKHVRCLWDGFCYFDPYPLEDGDDSRHLEITVCLKPQSMERFSAYALN